jgi:hypothetical protein
MSRSRKNKSGRAPKQRQAARVGAATAAPAATSSTAQKTANPSTGSQTLARTEAMPKYAELMEGIKKKIAALDTALPGLLVNGVGDLAKLQIAAVILRQTLETIAFASLIINKALYDQVHQDAASQWSAKRLLDKIEKLNPQFYPSPVLEVQGGPQPDLVGKSSGFLTRQDFIDLYDECSKIIHQKNPLSQNYGYTAFANAIPEWRAKIIELLNVHKLHLPGDDGFYLVHMKEEGDDHVHWYRFDLVGKAT